MTAPLPPLRCREKNPAWPGTFCTRPYGHRGGHVDESRGGKYWQSDEPQPALPVLGAIGAAS